MYKREILNDIERMQVRGRERDEKIQKFEQRLAELEKKMWDCKRENKRVLASSILKGKMMKTSLAVRTSMINRLKNINSLKFVCPLICINI